MVEGFRAFTFWKVLFLKKSEAEGYPWDEKSFVKWFKTLPGELDFRDKKDKEKFISLLKDSFEQMVNACANGNLG